MRRRVSPVFVYRILQLDSPKALASEKFLLGWKHLHAIHDAVMHIELSFAMVVRAMLICPCRAAEDPRILP